jgi:hypothetical protein
MIKAQCDIGLYFKIIVTNAFLLIKNAFTLMSFFLLRRINYFCIQINLKEQ